MSGVTSCEWNGSVPRFGARRRASRAMKTPISVTTMIPMITPISATLSESPPVSVLVVVTAGATVSVVVGLDGSGLNGDWATAAATGSSSARLRTVASRAAERDGRERIGRAHYPAGRPGPRAAIVGSMPPKARQIRIDQRGALADMQALETRSDEELEREQKYKSAALAILGARAAERYDAKAARAYYQRAIAAARPQERMQIRRMADASLALAERRPDDLKVAVERLGQEAPSGRQLFLLRMAGVLAPPASAGMFARVRGFALIVLIVIALVAIGFGIVKLLSLPFGGVGNVTAAWAGILVVLVVLGVMALIGRRRQSRARAARAGGG